MIKHVLAILVIGLFSSNVFANYALIVKSFGKLEYAEQLTRKAIQLKPHFPEAYSNLAVIFKELGKLEEAEKFLMKAILQKTKFVSAYYNLSRVARPPYSSRSWRGWKRETRLYDNNNYFKS